MIAAIDVETASHTAGAVCAIGIAILGPGREVSSQRWLVRPPGNRYEPLLTRIHGLSGGDTRDAADFQQVWPRVQRALTGADVVFAHNASFERRALAAALDRASLGLPRWQLACTMAGSRACLARLKSHRLSALAVRLGIDLDHHDPESDARACAFVARRLGLFQRRLEFLFPW